MEGDKQDVFINSLTLSADGRHLAIANERGQRFELGLDGSGVRRLHRAAGPDSVIGAHGARMRAGAPSWLRHSP
jgi:hypothetical protein